MAIVKDWYVEAAKELIDEHTSIDQIVAVIEKHSPFKVDVAYMQVPHCGSCKHWDNVGQSNKYHGYCRLYDHDPYAKVSYKSLLTHADFGCLGYEEKP